MRPVRLLAVSSTGQMSGAERVLIQVLTAAVRSGWQVVLAAPRGALLETLSGSGVTTVELPELGLASGARPVAAAITVRRWTRAAREVRRLARDADVMLVNSLMALPVARLARVRVPVVWHAHDVVVQPRRLRLYRLCRPTLSMVIGVSGAVAERLTGGRTRIEVVHNGVEWPVDPAAATPGEGPAVVGIAALLTPWKGHRTLLDAMASLPADVRVEIMGGHLPKDAGYAADLSRRAHEEAGGRVEMVGHVADPAARMRTWTVVVSASTEPEACPLNVLEAMSLGVPVVATDHGGAPEVLAGSGLLVPPGDAPALAAAVTRLLADRALRETCAQRGRERVATGHRIQEQTQRLLDLLVEVVEL